MASDTFNTGKANVDSAYNSGAGAINSFDPNAWASNTSGGLENLWNKQGTTQNDYFNAYKNAIASNPSATDWYNQGMQNFNVPQLQDRANTLGNAVLQAPISNVNAAKGFNYDNNQVQQKTAQDLQYLTPQANAAQNNATTAQGNAMNFANMGMQQNQVNLMPIQQQGQYLMDSYARQQSGFTMVAQSQLQALQDKMDQGVALSTSEMAQYASLTSSEQSYQSAVAQANAQIQAATIGANAQMRTAQINNQWQNPAAGSTLVNTFNGGYKSF